MKSPSISLIAIPMLFAGHMAPAVASGNASEPLAECVTLSADHQGARFGSQYLAIRDGDAYYRLEFSGSCNALNDGAVTISTRKETGRLCPTGSIVKSKQSACTVRGVTRIDANEFERYARRGRR
jgi:hypothetical protein